MKELHAGDKVDQYQLTELLARSGMASIFQAVDTDNGTTVALKVPHPQFESDVVFFERFRREELLGQRLDHPYIVRVLTPRAKSKMYLAMELVAGRSLRAIINERAPLPRDEALGIARQLCEALVYLHTKGVVHRDIKPENVLVTPDGKIKLIDFGIALDESARRLTWVGLSSSIGTPDYMSPEQIGGRRGDARSDVYAVGTMLYEMLTGHLPFEGPNVHAFLRAKAADDPRPPGYYVPNFDPSLEAIILKAIEHSPRDRHPSAAELLKELEDPASVPPRDPETGAAGRRRRSTWLPRSLRVPLVVTLVIAALAVLVFSTGRRPPPHFPAAASGRG